MDANRLDFARCRILCTLFPHSHFKHIKQQKNNDGELDDGMWGRGEHKQSKESKKSDGEE